MISDGEQGDLPRLDRRGSRVNREQLDVQRIQVIYTNALISIPKESTERGGGGHTNRDHALTIIIQILHQSLAQTIHLPPTTLRMIPGQESTLLLQLTHQIRQFLHHALIRAEILLLGQHQTEIEDEFIAVVPVRLDADRIAQDTVPIRADLK